MSQLPKRMLYPTVKPVNAMIGTTVFDIESNMLNVYNGKGWIGVDEAAKVVICVRCNQEHWFDLGIPLPDHPIFKNNLEMLEWEYERRRQRTND